MLRAYNFNFDAGILSINDGKKYNGFNANSRTVAAPKKDRQSVRLYSLLKHRRSGSYLD